MNNPILVISTRGDVIENRHRGAIAVCDPSGRLLHHWGDVDALVYPRSAIKALQSLPLLESGAAEHFQLSADEIALACSSHNAEPAHTSALQHWLTRLHLDATALECGAHAPLHEETAASLLVGKQTAGRIHNNCSGKHCGMLTTARFLEEETRGYIERDHPVQRRWLDALGEMADVDMRQLPWNRDGCGIPVVAMPLHAIATAFARFAAPHDLNPKRRDAIERIGSAIAEHPFMVAGTGRLCTELMELTGRRVMVKTGANGVYTAALVDRQLGIAIKIDDGNRDAAEVALLATLNRLDALHNDDIDALAGHSRKPITNTLGVLTGFQEPSELWR